MTLYSKTLAFLLSLRMRFSKTIFLKNDQMFGLYELIYYNDIVETRQVMSYEQRDKLINRTNFHMS